MIFTISIFATTNLLFVCVVFGIFSFDFINICIFETFGSWSKCYNVIFTIHGSVITYTKPNFLSRSYRCAINVQNLVNENCAKMRWDDDEETKKRRKYQQLHHRLHHYSWNYNFSLHLLDWKKWKSYFQKLSLKWGFHLKLRETCATFKMFRSQMPGPFKFTSNHLFVNFFKEMAVGEMNSNKLPMNFAISTSISFDLENYFRKCKCQRNFL